MGFSSEIFLVASHCVSTSAPRFGSEQQTLLPSASGTRSALRPCVRSLGGNVRRGIVHLRNQKVQLVKGFYVRGVKPAFGRMAEQAWGVWLLTYIQILVFAG